VEQVLGLLAGRGDRDHFASATVTRWCSATSASSAVFPLPLGSSTTTSRVRETIVRRIRRWNGSGSSPQPKAKSSSAVIARPSAYSDAASIHKLLHMQRLRRAIERRLDEAESRTLAPPTADPHLPVLTSTPVADVTTANALRVADAYACVRVLADGVASLLFLCTCSRCSTACVRSRRRCTRTTPTASGRS
jgi:hypothetical protein